MISIISYNERISYICLYWLYTESYFLFLAWSSKKLNQNEINTGSLVCEETFIMCRYSSLLCICIYSVFCYLIPLYLIQCFFVLVIQCVLLFIVIASYQFGKSCWEQPYLTDTNITQNRTNTSEIVYFQKRPFFVGLALSAAKTRLRYE